MVRELLARTFPVTALRAYGEGTPAQRSNMAANRWAELAALGAPGMLVPAPDGGLGLHDVDLVGIFEEAGWSALPEPLLETAGMAAPLLAALLPAPAAAVALRTLLKGTAPLAVGGIDIGPGGPSSPTTVSADGMLRTPARRRGARRRGLPARLPRPGLGLAGPRRAIRSLHHTRHAYVRSGPRSRRRALAAVGGHLVGLRGRGRSQCRPHGRSRRGRLRRVLERAGRPDAHVGSRRRGRAPPVRPAHREFRSGEAPPHQRQGQARNVSPGDVSCRLGSRQRTADCLP